jgi:hypothetical protein
VLGKIALSCAFNPKAEKTAGSESFWCPGPELNRYIPFGIRDFKSIAPCNGFLCLQAFSSDILTHSYPSFPLIGHSFGHSGIVFQRTVLSQLIGPCRGSFSGATQNLPGVPAYVSARWRVAGAQSALPSERASGLNVGVSFFRSNRNNQSSGAISSGSFDAASADTGAGSRRRQARK